jgi:hypothetical protein
MLGDSNRTVHRTRREAGITLADPTSISYRPPIGRIFQGKDAEHENCLCTMVQSPPARRITTAIKEAPVSGEAWEVREGWQCNEANVVRALLAVGRSSRDCPPSRGRVSEIGSSSLEAETRPRQLGPGPARVLDFRRTAGRARAAISVLGAIHPRLTAAFRVGYPQGQ